MKSVIYEKSSNNSVYGIGFIGAAVYFISTASSFIAGVIGFLKALVWPAILVYEAFSFYAKVEKGPG